MKIINLQENRGSLRLVLSREQRPMVLARLALSWASALVLVEPLVKFLGVVTHTALLMVASLVHKLRSSVSTAMLLSTVVSMVRKLRA